MGSRSIRGRPVGLAAAGWATLLVAGCAPPPPAAAGQAAGTVTLNGVPLAGGRLDFVSDTGTASTPIGRDGQFVIPSLPTGKYRVAVMPVPGRDKPSNVVNLFRQGETEKAADKVAPAAAIPRRYADPKTSGIEIDISAASPPLEIKLTAK